MTNGLAVGGHHVIVVYQFSGDFLHFSGVIKLLQVFSLCTRKLSPS